MKELLYIPGLILSLILVSCSGKPKTQLQKTESTTVVNVSQSSSNPVAIKKYQIKSGIVTFDNDMMGIKQKSILYFDDYGIKEAEEKYEDGTVKETNVCDGKNRFLLIHAQKAAYTSGTCSRGVAYKFDWNEISRADKEYEVKKLSNITIAGKDCESYSMASGQYPTVFGGWNNICLFMNTKSQFGNVVMKATKVEEDVNVPAEKFKIPAGYEIKKGL